MTRIAPITPEPVEPTPRRPMTPKRRLEVLLSHKGRCARCGEKINDEPWIANHRVPLAMGGADDLANLEPLHKRCDGEITPTDIRRIAKVKRIRLKHRGEFPKSPRPLKGRGFQRRYVPTGGDHD